MRRTFGLSSRVELSNLNALVKAAQYAVRGKIVHRSDELNAMLKKGKKLPFQQIISCNIGNPHALRQKSLSYIRDVVSLVVNPSLAERASFPPDVVERAQKYLASFPDIGAYSESQGMYSVREEVSQFLLERDGYPSDPNSIFLTNGAS